MLVSLLQHYKAAVDKYGPHNIIHVTVTNAAAHLNIGSAQLRRWGAKVQEDVNLGNAHHNKVADMTVSEGLQSPVVNMQQELVQK